LATTSKPIFGVTSKDDTLLQRLAQGGGKATRRLELATDLGVTRTLANVEAVPDALTAARAKAITQHYGKTPLVICRHILEHAGNLGSFLAGLSDLVAPGGYLMLEVPDCSSSLARRDYTMIWEEHSVYFTPGTFFRLLQPYGFEAELTETYPYPYENCLVLVARKVGDATQAPTAQASTAQPAADKHASHLTAELAHGQAYGAAFDALTQRLRHHLEAQKALKPVALYGAGHLTASFVNYHGLADLIDCVVDDTPQKQGLLLPGSGLPILSSAELQNRGIGLCLLGLAPEVEPKVVQRNAAFVESGGQFRSLLAASPSYVLNNPA
jgi:2-polyprenyl-3-methyl-5-hydroxy-6-metoxy-1,4-benzoquinol methylase